MFKRETRIEFNNEYKIKKKFAHFNFINCLFYSIIEEAKQASVNEKINYVCRDHLPIQQIYNKWLEDIEAIKPLLEEELEKSHVEEINFWYISEAGKWQAKNIWSKNSGKWATT